MAAGQEIVPSLEALTRIYGADRGKSIVDYLNEFEPYASNFPPVKYRLHEANGRPVLLVQCPVLFRRERGEQQLLIAVGFTHQFPERPPHCALLIGPRDTLVPNHPVVAPNGSIRLVQLKNLQRPDRPSLCDLLVAIMDNFETSFPLHDGPLPAAQQAPAGAPPPQQQPAPQGSAPAPPSGAPPPPAAKLAVSEDVVKASAVLMATLEARADEYLALREQSLRHLDHLEASGEALKALEATLAEKKRQLLELQPDVANLSNSVKDWRSNGELSDTNACIVPLNALHAQAIDQLAEYNSCEDGLEFLDQGLNRGTLKCDDYVKRVSAVARSQFMARYMLKKSTGMIDADSNLQSLVRRFSSLNEAIVREVLASSAYDVQVAAARLSAMS